MVESVFYVITRTVVQTLTSTEQSGRSAPLSPSSEGDGDTVSGASWFPDKAEKKAKKFHVQEKTLSQGTRCGVMEEDR